MGRFVPTGWATLAALCILGALGCQTNSQVAQNTEDSEWNEGEARAAQPMSPARTDSAPELETVYFDLDTWVLDEKGRAALQQNARQIDDHPEWGQIRIEGHCDARGSEEYNLLLGKRRASEVATYLRDLGVPGDRLLTVSFGEARPAVQGEGETAWKWNRRSVFVTAEQAEHTASR